MRIAVATNNGKVSGHFGHCEGFTVYNIEDNVIESDEFLKSPKHQPGVLPKFLADNNVNIIMAGGMGAKAQQIFNAENIEVVVGVAGDLKSVMNEYLNGKIESTESICTDHAHQGEGCSH
ncbi:MAG TPA: NifB/NifX family molybdenum-iron cluster-binding protein [Clostridia bacterium]|nr:NifB/NifX family molybdenum-iron cluster-binding protein [Clostridia bacterium]